MERVHIRESFFYTSLWGFLSKINLLQSERSLDFRSFSRKDSFFFSNWVNVRTVVKHSVSNSIKICSFSLSMNDCSWVPFVEFSQTKVPFVILLPHQVSLSASNRRVLVFSVTLSAMQQKWWQCRGMAAALEAKACFQKHSRSPLKN